MKYLFLLIITSFYIQIKSQYWQQEVNYKIDVKLNDINHTLSAFEEFEYINNSPNSLDFLYIHVWPNAYKNGETALGKRTPALANAPEIDRGFIDSLDFKVNGTQVKWEYTKDNIDIVKMYLSTPLLPNQRITVSTPFKVKIPDAKFSRLGHVDQSYQITQWYPKPAVYDKNGWNQMPYLTQGEFYSEFGSFDVKITLPSNYIVGATGNLQNETEIAFLNDQSKITQTKFDKGAYPSKSERIGIENLIPESAKTLKTLHYKQSKVHDFGWFADKRFQVLKGEVTLPISKRKVTSFAMFTPRNAINWKKSIEYLNDAITYYSKWNGEYPYDFVTAVDGTIAAGGGMEYPNVTIIGNTSDVLELEIVIVHEVGHNWFYGILGSNERLHGWMDEGLNTSNEMRYVAEKYPENTVLSNQMLNGKFNFHNLDHHDFGDLQFRAPASVGADQPIETHSDKFTSANYGFIMYQKTGLILMYLKDYLGTDVYDKCLMNYYETWKFKHPQPEDIRAVFEQTSGKNLSWLFDDLVQTTNHIDYKIKSVKVRGGKTFVTVKNKGQVLGPIPVSIMKNDSTILSTKWLAPGTKKGVIVFDEQAALISIDPNRNIPELNRNNNAYKKSRLFNKIAPIKIKPFLAYNRSNETTIAFSPSIGANSYDQFMLGMIFHNMLLIPNKFNFFVNPMYSFGRKSVSGNAELMYTWLPKTRISSTKLGVSLKTFKNERTDRSNDGFFTTINPYLFLRIGERKDKTKSSNTINFQGLYREDRLQGKTTSHLGASIEYKHSYSVARHQIGYTLNNTYIQNTANSDEFARASITANYGFKYDKNGNRWIRLRGFAGANYAFNVNPSSNQNLYTMSLGGSQGKQDLFANEYFFERSDIGAFSQQRMNNMGNFGMSSNFGQASKWMVTGNLKTELPIIPKIFFAYFDYGVFKSGIETISAYNFGLGINIQDIVEISVPLLSSKNIVDSYGTKNTLYQIRINLNINPVNRGIKLAL